MDEAIAELYSVFYCITSLRLKDTILEDHPQLLPLLSDSLEKQVEKAYRLFVKKVLREELSSKPLGILRPGVLHVMNSLYRLQRAKKVAKVVIYSNNGTLVCLEFIRDLIHEHLGTTTLIGECVYRTHPLRDEEQTAKKGLNDRYEKTWNSLRKVLIEGKCKAPSTLSVDDVYFFDDLDETSNFSGYNFTFNSNGNVSVITNSDTFSGLWDAYVDDNEDTLELSFSALQLEELEDDWEIIEYTQTQIRLKDVSGGNGETDYLTFTKN